MYWITYSWLACCASAPSIAALSVWVLFIFHTYRRRWKTVDIFLLTIALQEIPSTLCAFGYAVVTVIRTRSESSCSLVIWGLTTIRVFQMTTLTSLAFDRALTIKWPYKYRFSVRQSQIRYHIVVLCVISALVGVAGLFARLHFNDYRDYLMPTLSDATNNNITMNYYCTLHPYSWDYRYNIFISALYGFLTFITFVCSVYIEMNRYKGASRPTSRISSVGNLVADSLGFPEAIGRSESCRTLYGFQPVSKQGSINKKPSFHDDNLNQRSFDVRWSTVIGTLVMCYAVNHGPYLAFMLTGLMVPFWNPLHDNITVWLGIIEGLLMPFALYITDDPFKEAVKRSFKRRNYRCSDVSKSSDGTFPLYFNDFAMIDKKPYLMSSIPPTASASALTLISNYRRSFKDKLKSKSRNSNEPLMRPINSYMNSLRKYKLSKSNDKYIFLSLYGDKVVPMNKQTAAMANDGKTIMQNVNPYYKNCTTISTFTSSNNSIKKEKLSTLERTKNSFEKSCPWYEVNHPMEYKIGDGSWESHHEIGFCSSSGNNDKQLHHDDEHIYASLSETFSVRSTLPDKRQLKNAKIESSSSTNNGQTSPVHSIHQNKPSKSGAPSSVDNFSMSGVSFTTTANDDFEFTTGDDAGCLNTTTTIINGISNRDNEINDVDDRCAGIHFADNVPVTPALSSVSYSKESKRKNYDKLPKEYGSNVMKSNSNSTTNSNSTKYNSNSTKSNSNSTDPLANYHCRYSPFMMMNINGNYYKRRGFQSFSASDIHKLDSSIYSINSKSINLEKFADQLKLNKASSSSSSSPKRTLSETNLLLSLNSCGSMAKIGENYSLDRINNQHTHVHVHDDSFSDDSLCSDSTSSSWDHFKRVTQALKNKTNKSSSFQLKQNIYSNRQKIAGIRSKKYKSKRKKKQKMYIGQNDLSKIQNQKHDKFKGFSQSIWNNDQVSGVNLKHININRIGSYAQHYHHVNHSMPDLTSLTTCPSPVFSPLYRRESKAIRSANNND